MHTEQLQWFSWFDKPPLLSLLSLPLPAGPCCLLVLLMFLAEFTLLGLRCHGGHWNGFTLKCWQPTAQHSRRLNLEQQQQVDL
jgi:hypothetical protein